MKLLAIMCYLYIKYTYTRAHVGFELKFEKIKEINYYNETFPVHIIIRVILIHHDQNDE